MLVGLTGGIGSGKTTIAQILEVMGCVIYNSDERAKQMYFNPDVKSQVIQLLGNEAYLNNTTLNHTFISNKVFSNKELLHKLNSIIHPAVKQDFIEFKNKQAPQSIIIKESALLFETDIYKELPFNILVTAPEPVRIQRVLNRNHLSIDAIKQRMQAQWSDEKKTELADFVIENSGEKAVIPQLQTCLHNIKKHVEA
ncbi:MAG: dephospho-CoA kinase [Bacteroidia bacterium]|nr:dephospho-CoA kinase [Bacteroidia bacterium]